ncbi:GGDEF domain-containing protein [Pelosinus propionicus]|uniref:Diguanylate cyclase (GGDEF) domain-containing protein n=1 Tax=Pelosinus propionicus DSM 13327 TaxID=1123291 RepID=A0A1I4KB46_9FIRM|nr:GGDEF domain-containing protein [Pelosinus propionicus]SFL75909.1 diguanylate cyclase (GGDEF) domain-containing protein [Pelosinus propionicus DSM 13327]
MPRVYKKKVSKNNAVSKAILPQINSSAVATSILSAIRTTPLGIILLAGIAFFHFDELPASLLSAIPTISYMILLFGIAITSCFSRSRAFFILFILFLSQLGMSLPIPAHLDKDFALHGIYLMVSLLVPLNLLFFASFSERGILSSWGKQCFLFIFLQIVFVMGLVLSGDRELFNEISKRISVFSFMPSTPIPDTALAAFLLAGILLLTKRRRTNSHFKTTIFGALTAVAFAHHFNSIEIAIPFFYAVAGLMIIVSVIQDYYVKAYLDELTGLPSRRSLNEDMLKLDSHYTIAMVDVDFFKKFNDTYGHDAGDDVLRLIGKVMKNFKGGKPFRYGGEEFTVLFPGKSLSEAIPYLETLREEIAKSKFVLRQDSKRKKSTPKKLSVTVSIGAADSSHKEISPDEVIKLADKALYRAKENGRNCVSQ